MAQMAREAVIPDNCERIESEIRTVVVDDTEPVLDMVCGMLRSDERIEIVGRATNGLEALELVAETAPDLVVMDVNMPVMDGLQAAMLMAQHFPLVKVVLMSAVDSPKVREQCRYAGVDGFAYKMNFRQEFARLSQSMFSEREQYFTA